MSILDKQKQLKKELSLLHVYAIATGATIADGFFLLPGMAYSSAGPAMILSYLIAVIPVIPALFSMSELFFRPEHGAVIGDNRRAWYVAGANP
jgi:L-asparagine transporter-like permease